MLNVRHKIEGSELVIRVNLSETHGPSKSGKTVIIATTSGNVKLPDGTAFGLNVYKPR